MKDNNEVWVVLRDGAGLKTAIVCESGKQEAKTVRDSMAEKYGGNWKSLKTKKSQIALAKA